MRKVLITYAVRTTIPVELSDEEYAVFKDFSSEQRFALFDSIEEDIAANVKDEGVYEPMSLKILEEDSTLICEC